VIEKALSARFHRTAHRARHFPVALTIGKVACAPFMCALIAQWLSGEDFHTAQTCYLRALEELGADVKRTLVDFFNESYRH
jgi:hypothetical protein